MKLSKAQEEVLQDAKRQINEARSCKTHYEYFLKYVQPHMKYNTSMEDFERYTNTFTRAEMFYVKRKNGIALIHCNSKTLKKLESLGLIEILYDSTNESYGTDEIKVLNY